MEVHDGDKHKVQHRVVSSARLGMAHDEATRLLSGAASQSGTLHDSHASITADDTT